MRFASMAATAARHAFQVPYRALPSTGGTYTVAGVGSPSSSLMRRLERTSPTPFQLTRTRGSGMTYPSWMTRRTALTCASDSASTLIQLPPLE